MGEDYSIPLLSRLDRLDSIMKYMEGKQNLSMGSSQNLVGRVDRQCKPLEMAMREAYSKGSLLDRVASLEDRLFQLCMEIEASNLSNSKIQKSWGLTSGQGSKREISCSLPTFNNPTPGHKQKQHHVQTNRVELESKPQRLQQRLQQTNTMKQQNGNKNDNKSKTGKKGVLAPSWPHLRILGC